jgi:xanthine/uracil/vitamin C permease (AzgA family)
VLERFFQLSEAGTTVRTELVAGATTFALRALSGRAREVSWLAYLLAALFLLRFALV